MTDNSPKISVITACLNSRTSMENTILSVRSQTYDKIEYVVIDGGSTDGTVDIIKAHGKDVDFWSSEPDKGISDAFNKGIIAATGDIVTFLNSQDRYYDDSVLAGVAKVFSDHPEADIVYGRTCFMTDSGEIVGLLGETFTGRKMRAKNIMPHQSVFLRKNVFTQFGLYKLDYRLAMDYEHLLRATKDKVPLFVNEVWSVMSPGGVSDSNKFTVNIELFKAQLSLGVPFFMAFGVLLYHFMTALGLKALRFAGIYTLGHLMKKLGVGQRNG